MPTISQSRERYFPRGTVGRRPELGDSVVVSEMGVGRVEERDVVEGGVVRSIIAAASDDESFCFEEVRPMVLLLAVVFGSALSFAVE